MTIATMGRRMKNFDMSYLPADWFRMRLIRMRRCNLYADRRSFAKLLQVVHNHQRPAGRPSFTTQLSPNCGPS